MNCMDQPAQLTQLAVKLMREGLNKNDPAEMALWETINRPSYKAFVMGVLKSTEIEVRKKLFSEAVTFTALLRIK